MAQESILATERGRKKRSLREIADTKHRVSAPAGQTNQTFSVAPNKARGELRQVQGKDCVGVTDPTQCTQTPHTGWHVSASATITVTDN